MPTTSQPDEAVPAGVWTDVHRARWANIGLGNNGGHPLRVAFGAVAPADLRGFVIAGGERVRIDGEPNVWVWCDHPTKVHVGEHAG